MAKNCIAFKLNYCNGGANPKCIGFRGICSDAVMNYNVNTAKRGWCSHEGNYCSKCLKKKISREELEQKWLNEDAGFCNESVTLSEKYYSWYAEAGWNSDDKPRRINNKNLAGHLCVLTTVFPNMPDSSRFVFAMFVIKDVCDGGNDRADYVLADDYWRLEFRPSEVNQMNFWDIYSSSYKRWGQGLFRYFDDAVAVKFLEQAVEAKRGTPEEDFAKEFLKQYPYK